MTPVSIEPAAPRCRVKHSTTEPLRSLCLYWCYFAFKPGFTYLGKVSGSILVLFYVKVKVKLLDMLLGRMLICRSLSDKSFASFVFFVQALHLFLLF